MLDVQIMHLKDEYKNTAAVYALLFTRTLSSIRNNIRAFLTHYQAQNVIDLCCGTGEQLQILDKNDILLTGVDLSPAMLTRARKNSPESIHYLEADAGQTPLPDASYDGVIISFALHEKTALQHTAIFREACRLLRPDGHIIIADYSLPPSGMSPLLLGKMLVPAIERAAGINHYHNYRDWMETGALEGFLERENPGKTTLISPHFQGCIHLYAVSQVQESPLQASLKKIPKDTQRKSEETPSIFPQPKQDSYTGQKGTMP